MIDAIRNKKTLKETPKETTANQNNCKKITFTINMYNSQVKTVFCEKNYTKFL